jgi:four helix bundle protein
MQRFTDLFVWRRAHFLTLAAYRATRAFPVDEKFGLTSQLRRAAASIATNIAEGAKRRSKEYARFLEIAEGSAAETEYLLMLSRDLHYLSKEDAEPLMIETEEIQRMLHTLRLRVQRG